MVNLNTSLDIGSLTGEIGTRNDAYDFSELMDLLPDPDPVLQKRGDGAEILDSLTADGHLLSVMQTRKVGSLKKKHKWQPGVVNGKTTPYSEHLCAQLKADFDNINTHDLFSALLDTPFYGMTPLEIVWSPGNSLIHIRELRPLPHRWFGFDEQNDPKFINRDNLWGGETLPRYKFVFARHGPTYDNPYGLRLLSRCFWPILFKKGGLKFWVTFTEKYGMPFFLGKYNQGATEDKKMEMLTALGKMVQDAVSVIPDNNAVEMLGGSGKTGGSYLTYSRLIEAMNAEISKVIMGQTLTAEVAKRGSLAASKVHENVLRTYQQADRKMIKTVMEKIADNYTKVNAPGTPSPVFTWIDSEDPQKEFAERDSTLMKSGVKFSLSYLMRRYGYNKDEIELVDQGSLDHQEKEASVICPLLLNDKKAGLVTFAE